MQAVASLCNKLGFRRTGTTPLRYMTSRDKVYNITINHYSSGTIYTLDASYKCQDGNLVFEPLLRTADEATMAATIKGMFTV